MSIPLFLPDLIDPLDGWIGRMVHGRMHRFSFLRAGEFTGAQVEKLLQQYGIRIWGRELDDPEELAFYVKETQAVWAEYILCRAGVPLTTALLEPRNAQYALRHSPQSMPTPWQEKGIGPHSIVDHIVNWIDRLLG